MRTSWKMAVLLMPLLAMCSFSSIRAEEEKEKDKKPGLMDALKSLSKDVGGSSLAKSAANAALSNDEIRKGLKEALTKGINSAIKELGKADGYYKNSDVKIPIPGKLADVEKAVRLAGQGEKVDEFVLTMNRAAEAAVPLVVDIFADAISKMNIDDAEKILNGKDNEATAYFRKTSGVALSERIKPVVSEATGKAGVTAAYKELMAKAGPLTSFFKRDEMDLDGYVTRKGIDGLFFMIGKEEKNIRQNPAARATDLLQRVFGQAGASSSKPDSGKK